MSRFIKIYKLNKNTSTNIGLGDYHNSNLEVDMDDHLIIEHKILFIDNEPYVSVLFEKQGK